MEQSETLHEYPPLVGLFAELAAGSDSSPPPRRPRSSADTLACPDASPDSAPPPSSGRSDWCVDVGPALLTMSTFELWAAIERGQAVSSTRVWREGMECWTALDHLPEFALALAATPPPPPEPVVIEPPPSRRSLEPASGSPAGSWLSGARWIAAGAAVAVAAVTLALLRIEPVAAEPTTVEVPVAEARPATIEPLAAPILAPAFNRSEATDEVRGLHDERGQRRLPRTGKPGYGR